MAATLTLGGRFDLRAKIHSSLRPAEDPVYPTNCLCEDLYFLQAYASIPYFQQGYGSICLT
jgi:hypothetical protein